MLQHELKSNCKVAVLDLLDFEETDASPGAIPGSFSVDPSRLRGSRQITVPENFDLVLCCSSGRDTVSARAAVALKRIGVKNVWVLEGALNAWREQGLPVRDLKPDLWYVQHSCDAQQHHGRLQELGIWCNLDTMRGIFGPARRRAIFLRRMPSSSALAGRRHGYTALSVAITGTKSWNPECSNSCLSFFDQLGQMNTASEFKIDEKASSVNVALPIVYLARHGETAWTISGQHTGLSDLPLTPTGERNARRLGERLRQLCFAKVFTSPLQRAMRTCELAGFANRAETESALVEWNYGEYEGLRSADILASRPDWDLFRDGCPGGESPREIAERADRVVEGLRTVSGNALLFSSGHFIRVLAARWLGLEAGYAGRHFFLSTASLSALGYERNVSRPVIRLWNDDHHVES